MSRCEPAPRARPGEDNYPLFDRWSLGHVGKGAFLRSSGVGAGATFAIAVAWEVLERPLKDCFPALFPESSQDTLQNMVGDVISTLSGWTFAHGAIFAGGRP